MAATWVLTGTRSVKSVQVTTEAAPTLVAEGMNLDSVRAVTVWLEADSGQTLSGAGTVDVYVYDTAVAAWALAPVLPFSVPSEAASKRRVVLGTIVIDNPRGRLACIANAVTVSSGGVTVYVNATQPTLLGSAEA